jgi:DNA-directed RNA polymerase subunit H (RpoH/RPB5)
MSSPVLIYNMVNNSRVHILEMLEDRGYDISQYKNYNSQEMLIMLTEHLNSKMDVRSEVGPLDILVSKVVAGDKVEKTFIKYKLDDKFKKTEGLIKQINEIYDSELIGKNDTLIVINVARVILKPGIKDKPDEDFSRQMFVTKGYFIQLFGLENFIFNVSRHELVPKHSIMTKSETDEMMKKYNIKNIHNLPTIKMEDAQAKYIGLRPRQVCRIHKTNITSGETLFYRYCML